MSQERRKFSPQFKAEAVQFVIETGRPINEIAKELEIHEGKLGHWVKQWKDENPETGNGSDSYGKGAGG